VLEFNTRFGDPETQPILARLKGDLVELCWATATGQLDEVDLSFDQRAACCVVVCSKGYPGSYPKGLEIEGLDEAKAVERAPGEDIVLFHAGTAVKGGKVVTAGGRVIGVTALAASLERASELASLAAGKIRFDGAFYRPDIGRPRMQQPV
jgi:phosphoribosylamine--glycine ligase